MPLNPEAVDVELVVVHVCDEVNHILAGHDGGEYTSPPHAPGDALALVELLLGRPAHPDRDQQLVWRCPVAGGQRTITSPRRPPNTMVTGGSDAQPRPAPASPPRGVQHAVIALLARPEDRRGRHGRTFGA